MDLILWRHAEAEDGVPDMERQLTSKGRKQAAKVAAWLEQRLPAGTLVMVSPATRARQTADALTAAYETVPAIAPGAAPTALLEATGWPESGGSVLIVGHQPTLGQVAGWLLAGETREWALKKGGVLWLTRRMRGGTAQVVLKAAISPDLL
ncbi:MAG: histidine phosphatase family protein [Burkholderiales bacterium]|nr:histidine phosphatase family protein [Burkholderiales bacterium]